MIQLFFLASCSAIGVLIVRYLIGVVQGHADNLSNPYTRAWTIALFLFIPWVAWSMKLQPLAGWEHAAAAGFWYWTFTFFALPSIVILFLSGLRD